MANEVSRNMGVTIFMSTLLVLLSIIPSSAKTLRSQAALIEVSNPEEVLSCVVSLILFKCNVFGSRCILVFNA